MMPTTAKSPLVHSCGPVIRLHPVTGECYLVCYPDMPGRRRLKTEEAGPCGPAFLLKFLVFGTVLDRMWEGIEFKLLFIDLIA
jgi:hypothetical protein